MTPHQEADRSYGPIVFQTNLSVVRIRYTPEGNLHIYCHKKDDGIESLPLGYVLGHNILVFDPLEK
jgi:hypothetical protein